MLTSAAYFMGRDVTHEGELTDEIRANAAETVRLANLLLARFYADDGRARGIRSGWRPVEINRRAGGARKSLHLMGKAVDIEDDNQRLAYWCAAHKDSLEEIGIWMERPEATVVSTVEGAVTCWCHWQTDPPDSGARYFWPSVTAYRLWVAQRGEQIIV